MTRAAFLLPVVLGALGCGNIDRDVIVANPELDGQVAGDAGASTPSEEDAAPPPRHVAPTGCPWDGGCLPIRCAPHECSRYCPYGCEAPYPSSPATEPRTTYHSRPRAAVP